MNQPNILFVVWDACRYDHAVEHASYLNTLASSNIWFENAIAPSPWSLPSHASFFTGELPHEHNRYRFGDAVDTPLVSELSSRGYTTYGISANGFASQRTGFHEDFDEFWYTGGRDLYLDGLDVSGTAQDILRKENSSYKDALREVLGKISRHDHKLKSIANLFAVSCGELATKFDAVRNVPHPVFAPTSDYSYTPEKNTRLLESVFESHDQDEPFFIFTNYMDTHRCYKPSDELQEKHIGRSIDYDELIRLNEEVAAPWAFEEKKARGELDESDIEDVRGLYAGEVETVDSHLRRIHNSLASEQLLENTLVVVTADHGENLGETDEMGRRRLGHVASVSEAVLRVPLVVARPDLTEQRVSEPVSIKNLYDLFLHPEEPLDTGNKKTSGLYRSGPIASQYPATGGGDETTAKHPEVPEDVIRHQASQNSAVAYADTWKVVAESTGQRWADEDGNIKKFSEVPETFQNVVLTHLRNLSDSSNVEISEGQVSRLEALGYI